MLTSEDNGRLGQPIAREELTKIFKECAKDKSLEPDGWGVELLIHFMDLMIPNFLVVAGESRIHGFISGAINVNFIAVIPKRVEPRTFADYHPISLCNSTYEII